jgi:peptide/nickel transport system substrate-binding protein
MRQFSNALSRRSVLQAAGAAGALIALPRGMRSASAQSATPIAGGTLTFGTSKLPQNVVNPLVAISSSQFYLIDALFLRLVYGRKWGDGMNPDPSINEVELGVAETMTEIETDRVWEFTLRQNVLWHDGTPVTADDVIFGIWLALNKDAKASGSTPPNGIKGAAKLKTEGGGSLTPPYDIVVEGATKLGDYALRIELEKATPNYWVNWQIGYWPMPVHLLANLPLEQVFGEPYATMPVGNGPYKAVNFVDGQYMELEANDDFYLGRPHVDKWIVRFGDPDTLAAALESQEIDGTIINAGPAYDRLTSMSGFTGNPVISNLPIGFATNCERFPDEAATLNKAMMHAIDVPTLNEQLFSNTLTPSNYLFEHVVGLETPPDGFPTYDYDPEKAQALLKEINWDSSKTLEWMIWSPSTPTTDAMLAMLEQGGIKAKYKTIDVAAVVDELYKNGSFDIVHANFQGSQDMEFNWVNIKCGASYDNGGFNYARYCNEEVDKNWQAALDATDPAERKALFDQASLLMGEDPPQATLWRSAVTYVWNNRVQGAYPYQYQQPVRTAFERVWLEQ